ncbi:VWA domain-containing protein [Mycoplasmatota bacterium zrk1]
MVKNNLVQKPVLAAPNESHLACVLLLDTSGSMAGEPIKSLNRSINDFKENVSIDELARKRVDISIIEFNSEARTVQQFVPITKMEPVNLEAGGLTAMGEAINMAIDKVKERCRLYANLGTPCFKPWIFLITDGMPTDDIDSARRRIKEEEGKGTHGKLKFFALGIGDYDKETLFSLTERVIELIDTDFSGIFDWISESMVAISVSKVDDNVPLPDLPENARTVPPNW